MDRAEALKTAVEHVKALTTNDRGYRREGLTLADQAAAVARFAEFLVGGEPADAGLAATVDRTMDRMNDDGNGFLRKDMP